MERFDLELPVWLYVVDEQGMAVCFDRKFSIMPNSGNII